MHPLVVHSKKAKFDVYIGRPGKWGNPFSHIQAYATQAKFIVDSRDEAVRRFKEWFLANPEMVAQAKAELRGKVLGCWCAPLACHGEVLASVANE